MQKGSKHTEEAKARIGAKIRGREGTFKGKTHSEETREKMAQGMRAYWAEKKGELQ